MFTSYSNRILDRFAERRSQASATIVDYKLMTPSLARVVATFASLDVPTEVLRNAVFAAVSNKAAPIEGSWRPIDVHTMPAVVGYVRVNKDTRPATKEVLSSMIELTASNMLMDKQDESLWNLTEGPGGPMLCRQETDALQKLMETARVSGTNTPRLSNVRTLASVGEFAGFVDPAANKVRFGYVLATNLEVVPSPAGGLTLDPEDTALEVVPFDLEQDNASDNTVGDGRNPIADRLAQTPVVVPCAAVFEVVNFQGHDAVAEVASPANGMNRQALLDYYKQLYRHRPDYYKRVVDIINNHASF